MLRKHLCILSLALFLGTTAARAAEKPNFLFIYTDDQRWDALGVVQREQGDKARFPWFQTPNLDRLAGEGVRFRNAFVVNSLCAPSRSVFLTGRYSHMNGVANNHTPFPSENIPTTWSALLKGAGYTTGYVGKFHHGQQPGPRPGFDYTASFVGQGKYMDCPFEVNGAMTATTGYVDDVSTDYALEFIGKNRDKPFAVVVGYKAAHGPFQPPPRLENKYEGKEARPAPNLGVPAAYAGKFSGGGKTETKKQDGKPKKKKVNGAEQAKTGNRTMLQGYFGCLAAVDENVGRLMARLDDLKLAENTVVVYTSDNGYYLGEHNLGDKRSAYEESMRIPLLVRYPKLGEKARGKTVDKMALNLDLAPTFLDLAGVKAADSMQGRSWRPLLEGNDTANWRTAFFYEYFYERNYAIPTVLAVRTDTAKLIKYPGHDAWTELFDLTKDPYEIKNLVNDAGSKELLAKMQAEFEKQAKAVDFRVPEFADTVPEQAK
ncbi:MAG TPA: sulfatase [Pirellulaceae bacterium]|jgi:arylsulfatase A-like enzyme